MNKKIIKHVSRELFFSFFVLITAAAFSGDRKIMTSAIATFSISSALVFGYAKTIVTKPDGGRSKKSLKNDLFAVYPACAFFFAICSAICTAISIPAFSEPFEKQILYFSGFFGIMQFLFSAAFPILFHAPGKRAKIIFFLSLAASAVIFSAYDIPNAEKPFLEAIFLTLFVSLSAIFSLGACVLIKI